MGWRRINPFVTTETRTRLVKVPATDHWGECFKEACARVVETDRDNARTVNVISRVQSVAEQLHHGRKVDSKQPAPGDETPGLAIGWQDRH